MRNTEHISNNKKQHFIRTVLVSTETSLYTIMDFDIFQKNQASNSLIEKDNDPAKYDEIASKLCDKRKTLEKNLENKELEQSVREDTAFDLFQIKKDMTIFGISEIDYQAYLANKEKIGPQDISKEIPKKNTPTIPTLVEPD